MIEELQKLRARIESIESNLTSQEIEQNLNTPDVKLELSEGNENPLHFELNHIPTPAWFSRDGNIRQINTNLQKLLNISQTQITEADWLSLIHPDDRRTYSRYIKRVRKTKAGWNREFRIKRSKQQYIFINEKTEPQFDRSNQFTGYLCIVLDISIRKKTASELNELRQIIDYSPISILMTDLLGNIEFVNPKFSELTGYSRKEVLGQNPRFLKSGDTPDKAYAVMWETINSGRQWNGEFHNRKKDGTLFWEKATIAPLFDHAGNIIHFLAAKVDVTSEKMATDENQRNLQLLQQTINGMTDPIVVIDQNHVVRFVNLASLNVLSQNIKPGYTLSCHLELIGEYMKESDPAHCSLLFDTNMKSSELYIQQIENKEDRYWEFESLPLPKKDGLVLIVRDVGEKIKNNEERLRTRKLESLADLAGGIAHDFNNILTAIIGNITLAGMQAKPDSSQMARLNAAEKSVLKAKELTQQLMSFSRGGAPIKAPKRLTPILQSIILKETDATTYSCDIHVDPNLWPVEIDEEQITLALQNIIQNAKTAMPSGGVITLKVKNTDIKQDYNLPAGSYVNVVVSDHGKHLNDDQKSRIFDPYYANSPGGFGLGMATAYSIIKQHHGSTEVQSNESGGTTISIYLPASKADFEHVQLTNTGHSEKSIRILVMDDEYDVRMIVGELLSALGYDVTLAENGEQTLDCYEKALQEKKPFDLIIMDLVIQNGMNGEETIKRLKSKYPDAKAIVSSGYFSDPVMANYKKYGFSGVVRKPYQISELEKVLHSVLEKP